MGLWLPSWTVTANAWVTERPPGSVAVTPTMAAPGATPTTVTVEPSTDTVATVVSSLSTVKASSSPSGSLKLPDTSRVRVSPTAMVACGISSTTTGGLFTPTTLTVAVWVADSPPGSVAVSVIVVSPSAKATTVIIVPDIEAVTTVVSPETAA